MIWQLPKDGSTIKAAFFSDTVFAYPTEAVYGLGGNPASEKAIHQILQLKGRAASKGLIMVANDWAQCENWIGAVSLSDKKAMIALSQERPTTFILPAGKKVARQLTDAETGRVALRISMHPIIQALCKLFNQPIISTSANLSGEAPAQSAEKVQQIFPTLPLIAGSLGQATRPSRIIDWETKQIIRQ
ncbi:L-threonylcarbamoyladenylate synthase [Suttonella ornithocola]|uniref:Threonylcarbamoyl-AMP synthase n=1 Tax=Suttonella ornithocola TaxID=279832 RepID=A0A380MXL5_9GAMM|nr:Sua5/YciO/YrdC/YwlC family protein [Suttonella ornithocola]SUO97022.1 t(6)A37 threonylcarbamoyladenosine biosynthesis protein RimN [Suttonella ornithocola]